MNQRCMKFTCKCFGKWNESFCLTMSQSEVPARSVVIRSTFESVLECCEKRSKKKRDFNRFGLNFFGQVLEVVNIFFYSFTYAFALFLNGLSCWEIFKNFHCATALFFSFVVINSDWLGHLKPHLKPCQSVCTFLLRQKDKANLTHDLVNHF